MTRAHRVATLGAVTALLLLAPRAELRAQADTLDSRLVALTWHKLSGEPLDAAAAAELTPAVQHASGFDRPDVLQAETARLQRDLAAADPSHEFVVRVGDNISEYDHARGEFSVMLFKPGFYVQVQAFRQVYRLVFGNAEAVRAIPMPRDAARAFDTKLAATGRYVENEIHFRVSGNGDPAGAITGPRVIRGEITAVRLLDRNGAVIYTPRLVASAATPAKATTAASGGSALAHADVAGLRVGVKAKDLEPALARMFGPVTHRDRSPGWYAGFASALFVNDMGCMEMPGQRRVPQPGAVCVTAYTDDDGVVRSIRIERVFPFIDEETFRATLVRKYGPVTTATQGGGYALGWGARLDSAVAAMSSPPGTAISAMYDTNDDMMSRGNNALPKIRIVLQLVDAAWAQARSK